MEDNPRSIVWWATVLGAPIGALSIVVSIILYSMSSGSDDDPDSALPPGAGTEEPSDGISSSSPPQATNDPLELSWSIQYLCDGDTSTNPYAVDFDKAVGDNSADEFDLVYEKEGFYESCGSAQFFRTGPTGEGGLVGQGDASAPESCRAAAAAESLPTNVTPDRRSEKGLIEGAAFCLITDGGRIVRAEIDTIEIGSDGSLSVIEEMSGPALIWELV